MDMPFRVFVRNPKLNNYLLFVVEDVNEDTAGATRCRPGLPKRGRVSREQSSADGVIPRWDRPSEA